MGIIVDFTKKVKNLSKIVNYDHMKKIKTSQSKYSRRPKTNKIIFAVYNYNEKSIAFISYEGVILNSDLILI